MIGVVLWTIVTDPWVVVTFWRLKICLDLNSSVCQGAAKASFQLPRHVFVFTEAWTYEISRGVLISASHNLLI